MVLLKHVRAHYERRAPQVLCGFGVTREAAEALLVPHPAGTFLLRFCSQVRGVARLAMARVHAALRWCAVCRGFSPFLSRSATALLPLPCLLACPPSHRRASWR